MDDHNGLLAFLAEMAHELATESRAAKGLSTERLAIEAEELMAIRSNIINRGAQLLLPLEVRKAA